MAASGYKQKAVLSAENHTEVSKNKEASKLKIYLTDVLDGIKKEMVKEAKPFTI